MSLCCRHRTAYRMSNLTAAFGPRVPLSTVHGCFDSGSKIWPADADLAQWASSAASCARTASFARRCFSRKESTSFLQPQAVLRAELAFILQCTQPATTEFSSGWIEDLLVGLDIRLDSIVRSPYSLCRRSKVGRLYMPLLLHL